MKLLIIGGQGFIGSHCYRYFTSLGFNVWSCGLRVCEDSNYIQLEKVNTDFNSLFNNNEKFDICINASGSSNVMFSFSNPDIDFELNVFNVNKILTALKKYSPETKFINLSSAAVYGNPDMLPIKEESKAKPLSPYGFHKLQSEYLLNEYSIFFGLKTCSLRIFSAYGDGIKKQLFWDLFIKYKENEVIKLFGTGNETRDFIHIDDLLQVILLVLKKAPFKGEIYNVGSGISTSILEAVTTFYNELNQGSRFFFSKENKLGDPLYWQSDISKIKELGFKQNVTLEEGLKRYAKWLKESN